MEKINKHNISVGYNMQGQDFFDLLHQYKDYIHSYFFSLTSDMNGFSLNEKEVLNELNNCNKYDMPANLLLNDNVSYHDIDRLMGISKDACNLKAITLLKPNVAPYIKDQLPDIEIHLSVRFWDWQYDKRPIDLLYEYYNLITSCIDVVNISGNRSYNDRIIFDLLKYHHIKTKMIVNEGCIINRSNNFKKLPEFVNSDCIKSCNKTCIDVMREYPWMSLTSISIYKETLKYFDYDILKISSRAIDNMQLQKLLSYWCNDDPTSIIYTPITTINIEEKYDVFLEWLRTKAFCKGDCFTCRACKYFYEEFTK